MSTRPLRRLVLVGLTFALPFALCPLPFALGAAQQPAPVPPIWQQDYPGILATVNKVRAGRDLTPKRWPNNGKVAVALSFDLDAETLFLRANQLSPQPLSRGEYGARVATPRILTLLEKNKIPA